MICIKEFEFDAAHYLPNYHGNASISTATPTSWW